MRPGYALLAANCQRKLRCSQGWLVLRKGRKAAYEHRCWDLKVAKGTLLSRVGRAWPTPATGARNVLEKHKGFVSALLSARVRERRQAFCFPEGRALVWLRELRAELGQS